MAQGHTYSRLFNVIGLAPVFFLAFILLSIVGASSPEAEPIKPNVVMIVIDDAALTDLGVYGGEAKTPHIDQLAKNGTLFTKYRTSPLCAPSRAMLLTGLDNHLTGIATIPEVLTKSQAGHKGYAMYLEPGVKTLAQILGDEGYQTFMTGKWHLGHGGKNLPIHHGFDRSFALDASGADNWSKRSYIPYYETAPWYDGEAPANLPEEFYSSAFIVDQMINYIDTRTETKPFFSFLGFQAVHIPVQAPAELIAPYRDIYAEGWDDIAAKRFANAQALGLMPKNVAPPRKVENGRNWSDLSVDEQELYAARMAVNAAMLEAMDIHIGRLMSYLDEKGLRNNTIFVVTSDNGPEPSNPAEDARMRAWMWMEGYDTGLEDLGGPDSYGFIGRDWAASTGAGHLYKFTAAEGGLRVPLIISGPDIPVGKKIEATSWVYDVAPTLLDILGHDGDSKDITAMTGRSLMPVIRGEQPAVYGQDEPIGIEVSGNSALFKGTYKLVRNMSPHGDGQWRLYDLAKDPGETLDIASTYPLKFEELARDYAEYEARFGVQPMPHDYDAFTEMSRNTTLKRFGVSQPVLYSLIVGGLVGFSLFLWLIARLLRRKLSA